MYIYIYTHLSIYTYTHTHLSIYIFEWLCISDLTHWKHIVYVKYFPMQQNILSHLYESDCFLACLPSPVLLLFLYYYSQ